MFLRVEFLCDLSPEGSLTRSMTLDGDNLTLKCSEIGQSPTERGHLAIAQGKHRDQCCPNLRFDRIGRCANEGLEFQVLLERLEQEFDLPAILVDRGDGAGPETMMMGDENENAAGVLTNSLELTQRMRTPIPGTHASQTDGLILEDIPVLRHRMFLDHLEQRIVFHAGDALDPGIGPFGKQSVVGVAPIIDSDGVRREVHLMGGLDVRHLAVGNDAETRRIAFDFAQGMGWNTRAIRRLPGMADMPMLAMIANAFDEDRDAEYSESIK